MQRDDILVFTCVSSSWGEIWTHENVPNVFVSVHSFVVKMYSVIFLWACWNLYTVCAYWTICEGLYYLLYVSLWCSSDAAKLYLEMTFCIVSRRTHTHTLTVIHIYMCPAQLDWAVHQLYEFLRCSVNTLRMWRMITQTVAFVKRKHPLKLLSVS